MRKLGWLALLCIALLVQSNAFAQLGDILTYGSPASGSITAESVERRYLFEAVEGDIFIARMNAVSEGLDSYLTLLDPNGAQIAIDDDSGGNRNALLGPVRATTSGAYMLVASSCCPGSVEPSTGDYTLQIDSLAPQSLAMDIPAAFELPASDSIAVYSLDVPGTSLVRLDVSGLQGSGSIVLTSFDPQNTQRAFDIRSTDPNSVFYPTPPAYAPAAGTYLVSIRRDIGFSGDASAQAVAGVTGGTLLAQSIALAPYTLGSTQSGTLDDSTPAIGYTFTGDASALLSLAGSISEGSGDFELWLYAPDGNINYSASTAFTDASSFNIDPLQLSTAGSYAMLIQRTNETGASVAGSSSAFSFMLSGSTVSSLIPGQAVSGGVDTTTIERTYRLDGVAGQRLRFTITPANDGFAPSVYIQGPELPNNDGSGPNVGAPVFNATMSSATSATFVYEVTLPVSGVYLVRISNGIFDAAGPVGGEFTVLLEAAGG